MINVIAILRWELNDKWNRIDTFYWQILGRPIDFVTHCMENNTCFHLIDFHQIMSGIQGVENEPSEQEFFEKLPDVIHVQGVTINT